MKNHIQIAIKKSPDKTQASLAQCLTNMGYKVGQSSISDWLKNGAVPVAAALLIEEMFDGEPSRYDLCPSLANAKKKKA